MMPPPTQIIAAVPTTLRSVRKDRHAEHERAAERAASAPIAAAPFAGERHPDVVGFHDQRDDAVDRRR